MYNPSYFDFILTLVSKIVFIVNQNGTVFWIGGIIAEGVENLFFRKINF